MINKKLTESFDRVRLEPERAEQIWLRAESAYSGGLRSTLPRGKRLLRVALIAALLSVFFITTAYAVSGIVRSTGTYPMTHDEEYHSLRELPKAEKILGCPATVPGRLGDYCFLSMRIGGEAVFDETNAVLQPYYGLHVQYEAPGKQLLFLDLTPVLDLPASSEKPEPTEARFIDDVEVRYFSDHYKLVPENYQKTAEDLAAEAAGHFYISFGADTIEERELEFVDFVLDGANYVLMDQNGDGPETLFQMAAEVIVAWREEVSN